MVWLLLIMLGMIDMLLEATTHLSGEGGVEDGGRRGTIDRVDLSKAESGRSQGSLPDAMDDDEVACASRVVAVIMVMDGTREKWTDRPELQIHASSSAAVQRVSAIDLTFKSKLKPNLKCPSNPSLPIDTLSNNSNNSMSDPAA